MATDAKWSGPLLKVLFLEDCNYFSVNVYMSTTFNVKITDICFPRMENKKSVILQIYVTMAKKPSHSLEFTLTITFKTNFILTENNVHIKNVYKYKIISIWFTHTKTKKLYCGQNFMLPWQRKHKTVYEFT